MRRGVVLALLLACRPEVKGDDTAPPAITCDPFVDAPVDKDPGAGPRAARALTGSITTTLEFDEAAEAAGYHDCTYVREYPEVLEITDQGWLCPGCDWYTKGQASITSGYDDCYLQISDSDATRIEHLGFLTDKAGTHFYRSGLENVTMALAGDPIDAAALTGGQPFTVTYADDGDLDTGGTLHLAASGTLTASVSTAMVDDPAAARTAPYACGWPLQSPGGPVESWVGATGEVFPNARLRDPCGEAVDLWDFRGRYVVIDAASPDCGPCNAMADTAEAFKAAMAAECVQVETITLLNQSLSAVNHPADDATLADWVAYHAAASPVLADLGFGYDVIGPYVVAATGQTGMSFPSAVLLDPEGRLIGGDHGYSDDAGGWEPWAERIRADIAARP